MLGAIGFVSAVLVLLFLWAAISVILTLRGR